MTALTSKQRVKVNAALTIIHGHGYDPATVSKEARELMAIGHPARSAYEQALNTFAQRLPGIGGAINKVAQLIEASDGDTVARYDDALTLYIQTGDNSGIAALETMIVADATALAIRTGETTADALAGLTIDDALGTAFDEMQERTTAPGMMADPTPAPAPAPVANQTFAFAVPGQVVAKSPAPAAQRPISQGPPTLSSGTAVRAPLSGHAARSWAGVPIGNTPAVRTAEGGYRSPKTGQALARAIGVPLASVAGQAAAAAETANV